MSFTDEQQWFNRQCELRGLPKLRKAVTLRDGELVSFKGVQYRVISKNGKPILEELVRTRKGVV